MKCRPRALRWAILPVVFWCLLAAPGARGAEDPYFKRVRSALQHLKQGEIPEAAAGFDSALDLDLNATPARDGMGLTLLFSGETAAANAQFSQALGTDPRDPVAQAGTLLCELILGNLDLARQRLTPADGKSVPGWADSLFAYLDTLAGRRAQPLGKTPLDLAVGAGLGTPTVDFPRLEEVAKTLGEFRFDDRPGLYATFDPTTPLEPAKRRNVPVKARKPAPPGKVCSGRVVFQAQLGNRTDVQYVQFQVDGRLAGITNSQPFRYEWDTTQVPNGDHTVVITGCTASGEVVATHTRTVRVFNAHPHLSSERSPETAELADAMMEMLQPHPSSKVVHYLLGCHYAEQGEREKAAAALEYVVAIDPDYQDARHRLIQAYGPLQAADSIWSGPKGKNLVAITFDDGPNPQTTPMLLDVLKMEQIPATFFLVGWRAQTNPGLVARMVQEGHFLANHSFNHLRMTDLTPTQVERELIRTVAVVREVTGRRMTYFRPPGGHIGPMVYQMLRRYGIRPVFWTVNCTKMQGGDPNAMAEYALNLVRDGGIILMHNAENTTIHALPLVVRGLQKRGMKLVTIEELMAAGPAPAPPPDISRKGIPAPTAQSSRASERTPKSLRPGRNPG